MQENSTQTVQEQQIEPQQVTGENINNTKKSKVKKVFKIVAIVLAFILTFTCGYFSKYIFNSREENVTNDLIKIIQNFGYVIDPETGEMRTFTESDYADALINGILDDYSNYYTKEEYAERRANMGGTYSDFGFTLYSNANEIVKISGNSPAYYAGLKKGDVVKTVCINGGEELTVENEKQLKNLFKNTASASECLIGAMLHYGDKFGKENLVIETGADGVAKTYGKGIMQTTYMLITGGAFKLTTAKVVWPDGQTCIHGKGIIATGENAVPTGADAVARALATF